MLLKKMDVGDSFTLMHDEDPHGYIYRSIRIAAKSIGMKVRSGTDEDKNRIVKRVI